MLAIESKQVIEMKEGNTIAPYTFRRVSNVYTPVKYELTGCIAGLNVVFPWLDLNIKSYDNIHVDYGIQECKHGQCLDRE